MTQQKLYTEEQLKDRVKFALYYFGVTYKEDDIGLIVSVISPIEIPSDEEIWDESNKGENFSNDLQFLRGAEWMRNKILNK